MGHLLFVQIACRPLSLWLYCLLLPVCLWWLQLHVSSRLRHMNLLVQYVFDMNFALIITAITCFDVLSAICSGRSCWWWVTNLPSQYACCNSTETEQLRTNFEEMVVPMFGACPSCVLDFTLLWCGYTCNPNQSSFVDYHGTTDHGEYITTFRICTDFCTKFYDACGDVDMGGVSVKQLVWFFISILVLLSQFPSAQSWCNYVAYTQPITIVIQDTDCFNDDGAKGTCA